MSICWEGPVWKKKSIPQSKGIEQIICKIYTTNPPTALLCWIFLFNLVWICKFEEACQLLLVTRTRPFIDTEVERDGCIKKTKQYHLEFINQATACRSGVWGWPFKNPFFKIQISLFTQSLGLQLRANTDVTLVEPSSDFLAYAHISVPAFKHSR